MAVHLSVAIQHHPYRPELPKRLRRLLRTKRGPRTLIEVVTDPDPGGERNPWRTARECWRSTPAGCTHRLVLQDDVLPCAGFLEHARRALTAKPDRIASFYLGTNATMTYRDMLVADGMGLSWVPGHIASWVPALALAIPVGYIPSLVEFDDGTTPIADDEVYGRWTRQHSLPWWCTIPSLVNHDDNAPSLMRDVYARGQRVAACWIGSCDPGLIDWTVG